MWCEFAVWNYEVCLWFLMNSWAKFQNFVRGCLVTLKRLELYIFCHFFLDSFVVDQFFYYIVISNNVANIFPFLRMGYLCEGSFWRRWDFHVFSAFYVHLENMHYWLFVTFRIFILEKFLKTICSNWLWLNLCKLLHKILCIYPNYLRREENIPRFFW